MRKARDANQGRSYATLFLAVALALVMVLTLASRAEAYVYWTNFFQSDTVGRAKLDGTSADQSFITGADHPRGVAVDDAHIYWTNFDGDTVGRANLDGSGADQSFIPATNPRSVAVDDAHIYWANTSTIGRANLDGSEVDQNLIVVSLPGFEGPRGVAVDDAHIYWTTAGTWIGRANLDGSGVDYYIQNDGGSVSDVAVDDAHIYWGNRNFDKIGRANLDGSGIENTFISLDELTAEPWGVAVDDAHIYWTDAHGIGRANLDGSGVHYGFITGASGPRGVEVDALGGVSPTETEIDSGPTEGSTIDHNTLTFNFSSNKPIASFECRLDSSQGADFQPCTSPQTVGPLSDGPHSFEVRATDEAENTDPSPASRNFTVDTTPPETSIYSGPAEGSSTNDNTPTFGFSSNEPGTSFECRVDGGSYSACDSPRTTHPLSDGPHSFEVRATDQVGHTDPSPALRSFAVDTTVPALAAIPPALSALPPDTVPPKAKLFGKRKQGAGRPIEIKVGCNEDCVVLATGRVVVLGAPHRGAARAARRQKAKFRLRPLARRLSAGQVANLKLRPSSRKARRRLRRLVRKGRKAQARIRVSYRDRAGNVSIARLTIRLRRG
jgi:hypothetical protein